jgi:hypothetical protein
MFSKRLSPAFLTILIVTGVLFGCSSGDSNDGIFGAVNKFGETVSTRSREMKESASVEMEKLFTFEYRVLEIPTASTSEEIQKILELAGKERWDCFHIESQNASLRIFCKRNPKTALKYIPRVF